MSSTKMAIGIENGKFFLIGPDGYSTTETKWNTREEAESAMEQEEKEEFLTWNY